MTMAQLHNSYASDLLKLYGRENRLIHRLDLCPDDTEAQNKLKAIDAKISSLEAYQCETTHETLKGQQAIF